MYPYTAHNRQGLLSYRLDLLDKSAVLPSVTHAWFAERVEREKGGRRRERHEGGEGGGREQCAVLSKAFSISYWFLYIYEDVQ